MDIQWTGDLDDDCTAFWNGLMLRAEWSNGRLWFWAVTDQATGEQIVSSNHSKAPRCESGPEARAAAERASLYVRGLVDRW